MTLTSPAPAVDATAMTGLPVVVIGAGPVGLAAAAHLLQRGIPALVLEQGAQAGAAMLEWGHVRLFSPWKHVTDTAAVELLAETGWMPPHPEAMPTGRDVVTRYLEPLAATEALRGRVRYGARVSDVSRLGMDRTRSAGRAETPFVIRVDGDEQEIRARAVIDASGTFARPNGIIASGRRPRWDDAVASHLVEGVPDVLGRDRARFAGTHTAVVGSGHSAATTLLALARLADREPDTRITWLIRGAVPVRVYGSDDDELDGRASLGAACRQLVESGRVDLLTEFLVDDVTTAGGDRVTVTGTRASLPASIDADTVVVATGFRPDQDPLREIRLALDDVVEAPVRLAPLIDPNLHSCGTVPPHGVVELSHPHRDSGWRA